MLKLAVMASLAVILLGFSGNAQAKLDSGMVNVSLGNKDLVPVGKAAVGTADDKWNGLDGASGDKVALTDAKGDKTDVTITYTGDGVYDAADAGFVGTPWENLLRHYLYTKAPVKITLSGLTPKTDYVLVVYSASNTDGRKTKFTVAKDVKTTTYSTDKKELADGVNYAKFTATADADGNVTITVEGVDDGEGNLNGLQISPQASPARK